MKIIFQFTVQIRKAWTLRFKLGFSFAKKCLFFPVFILLLFSQSFSTKTKCQFEFPDYSSCGLITSKLNQSVHAFLIRTVNLRIKRVKRLQYFENKTADPTKEMLLRQRGCKTASTSALHKSNMLRECWDKCWYKCWDRLFGTLGKIWGRSESL